MLLIIADTFARMLTAEALDRQVVFAIMKLENSGVKQRYLLLYRLFRVSQSPLKNLSEDMLQ